jgi:Sulfotransferase domain
MNREFTFAPTQVAHPECCNYDLLQQVVSAKSTTVEKKPDFFIVGAPKCGTSAMSAYLAVHPEIYMARKEMHFFGKDLRFAAHFYRRAEREYLREFDDWKGQCRIGEASVWYLFSKTAAAEIKAFNPLARIIVMLRDPVEIVYSLFHQFRFDGNEPLATFQEALAAEEGHHAGRRTGRRTYFAQGLHYRAVVRLAEQLQRYLKIFGRERVHVVFYDDLAADPATVYVNTLKFLEVDPILTLPGFQRINPAKAVRSRAVQALINEPAIRSALLAIRPMMPRSVFNMLNHIECTLQRYNSCVTMPPPLDPELQLQLRREFAPEIGRLSELTGRDLTRWSLGTAPPKSAIVAQDCPTF